MIFILQWPTSSLAEYCDKNGGGGVFEVFLSCRRAVIVCFFRSLNTRTSALFPGSMAIFSYRLERIQDNSLS